MHGSAAISVTQGSSTWEREQMRDLISSMHDILSGGHRSPFKQPYNPSHQSGIPCSPDSLPPLIIIAKMLDYHFIFPIYYQSPTNSCVLTLPNCPSSAMLQFGPETPIPRSVTMMSGHSNSANSNNAPSSVSLQSVQSDHVHNNIQVLDVESDNIHTNPPIDRNANNQSEDENEFSVRPVCRYQCLTMIDN
jgi:hypothetical protein